MELSVIMKRDMHEVISCSKGIRNFDFTFVVQSTQICYCHILFDIEL